MPDAVDFLFGDESAKGIKFQRDDNNRRQDYIEQKTEQARDDVLDLFPQGQDSLREGYRAAIDVARRAPQRQIASLQNTNQRAQENVLAGMGEYRRAIMGLPSQQDPNHYYQNPLGLKPFAPASGSRAHSPFWQSRQPGYLSESSEASVTSAPVATQDNYIAALRDALSGYTGGGFGNVENGNKPR